MTGLDHDQDEAWWQAVDAAYARLRADPTASAEFDAEMAAWDLALFDGLVDWPHEGLDELPAAHQPGSAPTPD